LEDHLDENGKNFKLMLLRHLRSSGNTSDAALSVAEVTTLFYFDEAHVLVEVEGDNTPSVRSKYHLLGRVLAKMNAMPIFAVFLSTNPRLGAFAPSTRKIASLRDWDNTLLHAPFTELSFDTFANNSFAFLSQEKSGNVLLEDVGKPSYLVKFGRPM
jgi:hypothetical protein